jgi:hypothetical protein
LSGVEISRGNVKKICIKRFVRVSKIGRLLSEYGDVSGVSEGRAVRVSGCFHSGQLRYLFQQLTLYLFRSLSGIASLAEVKPRQRRVAGIETLVDGERFDHATHGDKGSRDGDAAERNLCRQQDVAERSAPARTGLTSPTLDGVVGIGLKNLPQWHQPKQYAGKHGDQERHQDQ